MARRRATRAEIPAEIDPEAVRAETRERIAGWNRLGRELCGRFIEQVRSRG